MALFNLRRIVKEDFPSKYYDLLDKLLYPLNQAIDSLNSGFSNGLTVAQNLAAQQITITVAAPVSTTSPVSFRSTLSGPCTGIICINAVPTGAKSSPVTAQPFLTFANNGAQISVTNITGLVSGSSYNLTLYCFA